MNEEKTGVIDGEQQTSANPPTHKDVLDTSSEPQIDVKNEEISAVDESGVPYKNRFMEAQRKLEDEKKQTELYKNLFSQSNALTQPSHQQQQQPIFAEPMLIQEETLREYESSGDPKLVQEAFKYRQTLDLYNQQKVAAERQKIKAEVYAEQEAERYKQEAIKQFPEILQQGTPPYVAIDIEVRRLQQAGYRGPDLVLRAAKDAKVNNPILFTAKENVSTRDELLASHNVEIPKVKSSETAKQQIKIDPNVERISKTWGNDPQKIAQRIANLKASIGK